MSFHGNFSRLITSRPGGFKRKRAAGTGNLGDFAWFSLSRRQGIYVASFMATTGCSFNRGLILNRIGHMTEAMRNGESELFGIYRSVFVLYC